MNNKSPENIHTHCIDLTRYVAVDEAVRTIPPETRHLSIIASRTEKPADRDPLVWLLKKNLPESITALTLEITFAQDLSLLEHHPQILQLTLERTDITDYLDDNSLLAMLRSIKNISAQKLVLRGLYGEWDFYDYPEQKAPEKLIAENITELDLRHSFYGIYYKYINLFLHEKLTRLDLGGNFLDHTLASLKNPDSIKFPESLEYLGMQGNNLGNLSIEKISLFLQTVSKNTTIDLTANHFESWPKEKLNKLSDVIHQSGKEVYLKESAMLEAKKISYLKGSLDPSSSLYKFFHHPAAETQINKLIFGYSGLARSAR